MKTLSEYEKTLRELREFETAWVGVACDHCGGELYDPTPGMVLMCSPPKINVRCSKCDFSGYMTK